jgi:hypothetical protein
MLLISVLNCDLRDKRVRSYGNKEEDRDSKTKKEPQTEED